MTKDFQMTPLNEVLTKANLSAGSRHHVPNPMLLFGVKSRSDWLQPDAL